MLESVKERLQIAWFAFSAVFLLVVSCSVLFLIVDIVTRNINDGLLVFIYNDMLRGVVLWCLVVVIIPTIIFPPLFEYIQDQNERLSVRVTGVVVSEFTETSGSMFGMNTTRYVVVKDKDGYNITVRSDSWAKGDEVDGYATRY